MPANRASIKTSRFIQPPAQIVRGVYARTR
jgi:hypothetical protein